MQTQPSGAVAVDRPPLSPKNGKNIVALLAGGPHDIFIEVRDRLQKLRSITVQHHWEYHRPRAFAGKIPVNVDFVIILKDMLGHSDQDRVVDACDKRGVLYMRTTRKWSAMAQLLSYYKIDGRPFDHVVDAAVVETPTEAQEPVAEMQPSLAAEVAPAPCEGLEAAAPPPAVQPVPLASSHRIVLVGPEPGPQPPTFVEIGGRRINLDEFLVNGMLLTRYRYPSILFSTGEVTLAFPKQEVGMIAVSEGANGYA